LLTRESSQDGVVHVVESVLMPPRHNRPDESSPEDDYENDQMSVEELKNRLRHYVDDEHRRDHDRHRSHYHKNELDL